MGHRKDLFSGKVGCKFREESEKWETETSCFNFSAWQDDDLDDPLISVVGQIHHFLHAKQARGCLTPDITTRLNEFIQAANTILSKSSRIASKIVEHHIGINPAEVVEAFGNFQAQRVEAYSDAIQARVDIKNRLINLAEYVWSESGYPLVIIIDDLDRCRPTFAIALLERIKHLFDVRHVTFVLGLDQDQFVKMLHNVYGSEFDATNYLCRLIDIEFKLPKISHNDFVKLLISKYSLRQYLAENEGDKSNYHEMVIDEFTSSLVYLSRRFDLSFREIERIVREMVLVERIHPTFSQVEATLIVLLICLRNRERVLYDEYVRGNIHPKRIVDVLLPTSDTVLNIDNATKLHMTVVVFASSKNTSFKSAISDLAQSAASINIKDKTVPNVYMNDPNSLASIAQKASDINISHDSVVNIAKALNHFQSWYDSEF